MKKSLLISFLRLLLGVLPAAPGWLRAQEIIAHRGASHDAPENSLSAMKLGWEQGADGIELDLWLSKDGKILVFHDSNTKRYAPAPVRSIKDLTWEEAAQLDIGAIRGDAFKGERIPTLESILATVPAAPRRAVLELKDGPEMIPEFARIVKASGLQPARACVISFNEATLRASKKALPDLPHYFLHGYKKDPKTGEFPRLEPLLKLCGEAGFQGLNLHHDWPVTPEFARQVKSRNLKLLVWTIDDAGTARRWADAGVDAITTNRPGWLRSQLSIGN